MAQLLPPLEWIIFVDFLMYNRLGFGNSSSYTSCAQIKHKLVYPLLETSFHLTCSSSICMDSVCDFFDIHRIRIKEHIFLTITFKIKLLFASVQSSIIQSSTFYVRGIFRHVVQLLVCKWVGYFIFKCIVYQIRRFDLRTIAHFLW